MCLKSSTFRVTKAEAELTDALFELE